ncbi:hypothetical protein ACTGJ9_006305 [Bradyrhizobium sp. RDM12]
METTGFRQSRGSSALDSDQVASRPPTASYIRARAARAELSPDDPIPLFLSDPFSPPDPREFAPRELRTGARIVPRILAAILAAAAIAVPVALFQSDINRLLSINTKSWMGAAVDEAAASANPAAARQSPVKDAARVTNTMLASADALDMSAPAAPSREAIATAYQTALQVQPPAPVPASVTEQPASPAPAKTLDADTLAGLMTRAKSLLRIGDIVAARLLLERAANAQDATAALLLAQTYDPAVLGTRDTRSVNADAAAARDWYQRAAALGSSEAEQRLALLSN